MYITNRELGNKARAALREIGFSQKDVKVKIEVGFCQRWIDAQIINPAVKDEVVRPVLESLVPDLDTTVCLYSCF